MARGAGLDLVLELDAPAWLPEVEALSQAGVITGASGRNWESYGFNVDAPADLPAWRRDLLCDPQTSGGLLVAVSPTDAGAVLALVQAEGYKRARVVGRAEPGSGRVRLEAGSGRT